MLLLIRSVGNLNEEEAMLSINARLWHWSQLIGCDRGLTRVRGQRPLEMSNQGNSSISL